MMKRALLATIVLSLVVVAAWGLWFHRTLWGTRSSRTVEFEIEAGSTAREILARLHAAELLPSELTGRIYLKTLAPGQSLYYGHYQFPSESRPVDVLEVILEEARRLTKADAGSLYVVEGQKLHFRVNQNDTLLARLGADAGNAFRSFSFPIDEKSISGSVARNCKTLNISDVQTHPLHNKQVDQDANRQR